MVVVLLLRARCNDANEYLSMRMASGGSKKSNSMPVASTSPSFEPSLLFEPLLLFEPSLLRRRRTRAMTATASKPSSACNTHKHARTAETMGSKTRCQLLSSPTPSMHDYLTPATPRVTVKREDYSEGSRW